MSILNNIVVLDLTRFQAGPHCTYLLGQLGAYIIKVEKPFMGDDHRLLPPMYGTESLTFPSHNLNKHSLCMKLRSEKAKEILLSLLPHVDIVAQNFRPGTIEKMGLDWETVHRINPRIILANQSGFGQTGPYRDRAAFDGVMQCESGMAASLMNESGGTPYYVGGNPCDHMGATVFTMAVMAALLQREKTGEGQYVDVDMMSAGTNLFSTELSTYNASDGIKHWKEMFPEGFFKTADKRYVCISCPDECWDGLVKATGSEKLAQPEYGTREQRIENAKEITAEIEAWSEQKSAEELRTLLEPQGIGVGTVKGYDDLSNDPFLNSMDYYKQVECPYVGDVPVADLPITISGVDFVFHRAPKLGEENREILQRFLGMSEEEIQKLYDEGILYQSEHAFRP